MRFMSSLANSLSVAFLLNCATAQGNVPAWQQCGGDGWTGATVCVSGYTCSVLKYSHLSQLHQTRLLTISASSYYHQCVPGSSTPTTTSARSVITSPVPTATASNNPTSSSSRAAATTTLHTATTTAAGGSSGGGDSVPTTLVAGWSWIRAVASPNFHSYLQAKPTGTPSKAYLESPGGAGQYKIEAGQLVYLTGSSSALYLNVENPADKTQRKLETWFSTDKNAFGTFAFQGDTLTWSTPEINRPNLAAWLVCEDQQVFINTGAYLYQTPAGCFDQTIHSYGGSTADL